MNLLPSDDYGARLDIILTKPSGEQIVMVFEARSSDSLLEYEISDEITADAGWSDSAFVAQLLPTGRHGFKLTGESLHIPEPL